MNELPDYKERSQAVLDKVAEIEVAALAAKQAAQVEIFKDLPKSIQNLRDLRDNPDPSIKLKAIREHCLLAGLYTEKHEHSGPGGTPLVVNITQAQADKIVEASKA